MTSDIKFILGGVVVSVKSKRWHAFNLFIQKTKFAMVLNSVLKTPDYPYNMIRFPEISGLGKGSIKLYSFI